MVPKNNPLDISQPDSLPEFANIGLGGVSGSGKTHMLGTVGKGNRILVIDTEGGTITYNSKFFKEDKDATELKNIDVIKLNENTVDTAPKLVHEVEKVFDHLIRTKNEDEYTVVALDSMTEFQQLFLNLHNAPDPRQSYGALKDAMWGLTIKARKVPANTVFTATLKSTQDEVMGREIVRFDLAPSTWSTIQRLFDVIGYIDIKSQGRSTVRKIEAEMGLRYQGKDRYGLGSLKDPSMADVLKVIQSNK